MERDSAIDIHRKIRLGRMLGEGAMGEVYEGFEEGLGAHSAVKFLKVGELNDPDSRQRFDEEAKIMATLEHPGCLSVHGIGESETGVPFYAMQKVRGKTLSDFLMERRGQIKSLIWRRRLLSYFQSICEVVAFAHGRGIIHRDIKPDNIMIDPLGSLYVIDWGLAKRASVSESEKRLRTMPGMMIGTPGYMAPEQTFGESANAGPESDVFALGVILYEILTGVFPFGALTVKDVFLRTQEFNPENPIKKNSLLPRSICAVCMKALSKEELDRYPDAEALLLDIQAFNEGRAVSVRKPGPIEKLIYWSRKKPTQAIIAGAAAVCVASVVTVFAVQANIDRNLAKETRQEIAYVGQEVEALRGQIAEKGSTLPAEISVLETRLFLKKLQVIGLRERLQGLRFISHDEAENRAAIEDFFAMLESGIESHHEGLVIAIIDSMIQNEESNSLLFKASDVQKLLAIREQALKVAE